MAMASSSSNMDWQIGLKCVKDRASKVLDSGQWSDCIFIVGTEGRQETIQAHKLILAMASPVFEAMFYGSLADKDEKPIEILDVQPQAFRALLKYLYTDEINFLSFDQVCEICYAAKKYMIPPLVEECTKYIWKDLHPGNVCRAFAFVRLFEEPRLLEQCMQMIKTLTEDVVRDQSFEEVDTNTLKAILSQETLNVGEMDLWDGVVRWSKQECIRQSLDVNPVSQRKVLQELLPLFRFLTFSPTQFANGPALSNILTQEECFNLLMNISSPGVAPMPTNFSTSNVKRKPPMKQESCVMSGDCRHRYPGSSSSAAIEVDESEEQYSCNCAGPLTDVFINDQLMDCSLSFSVDAAVNIVGVILPTQLKPPHGSPQFENRDSQGMMRRRVGIGSHHAAVYNRYPELIYAFLQDNDGCRLTYTHFSALVPWESSMEVMFNRPILIVPGMTYKIVVVLNKMGRYPLYTILSHVLVNEVNFSFDSNPGSESVVRTLIFKSVPNRETPDLCRYWPILEL